METIRTKVCANPACDDVGKVDAGNIILHASFNRATVASQRCLCKTCKTTFSASTGTAYFGLRCTRDELDQVMQGLVESEDSKTVNTSFVERLNLTICQSLSYLQRRSPAHARNARRLDEDLDLVQCHYNFIRRHMGLKFGRVCKTPAMQARPRRPSAVVP